MRYVVINMHELLVELTRTRLQALPPKDIKFAPLNKTKEYTAEEMMTLYKVGP